MSKPDELAKKRSVSLGSYEGAVSAALSKLNGENIVARIWGNDFTVWKPEPTEISNRLGWLRIAATMEETLSRLREFAKDARQDGFTHAVLLGMGGSSLAPDVFSRTFGAESGYPELSVLDSTHPDTVVSLERRLDLNRTLFIVSTKSGTTAETLSFFKYFYNKVFRTMGAEKAGKSFAAVTDPGSKLEDMAKKLGFRAVFLNDSTIGGRYSALSYFGLAPAALLGMDVKKLLDMALDMAMNNECAHVTMDGNNEGAWLGAVMGTLALAGRDKVTLILSPAVESFGAWVEQLIAESTGKENTGILPVTGEEVLCPESYSDDRFFVYARMKGDPTHDDAVQKLKNAGHPVVELRLNDLYDLGGEFFRWEMATAVAGYLLGINPFNQPNVEAAKVLAKEMIAAYRKDGQLPGLSPTLTEEGIKVYSDGPSSGIEEALNKFMANMVKDVAQSRSYAAIQAYIEPTSATDDGLRELRTVIQERFRLATTVGYGPRFLHSTGQLHKGDAGHGLFIQITDDASREVPIPDEAGSSESSMSFGVLVKAQALGDRQALLNAHRNVIRFDLGADVPGGLKKLKRAFSKIKPQE